MRVDQLAQGKDFTLTYKKNTTAKSPDAKFSIKGKGNFKGTIKDIPFEITQQNLSQLQITTADLIDTKAKNYNKVIPVITDLNGKKLKNKTDFAVVNYAYGDNQTSGNPVAGTTVTITVEGTGVNYTTEKITTEFRVIAKDKDIAKATIKINNGNPYIYTGNAIEPNKNDIDIRFNGGSPLKENDYEIISYTNNIKKGTAKLTIHGLGEYGGTKTVTYKIIAQPMS